MTLWSLTTGAHSRLPGALRNATIGLFVVALLGGMLLPVYSDEIGWRLQERAWLDGVDKLYSENCGLNTLMRPPFFMWPARAYSAFFNTLFADPFYVRLSGVAYALVWTWLLLRLVARLATTVQDRRVLGTIAIALMGLGVMPLLLVWSRPEQPLLLAMTTALLLASAAWTGDRANAADAPPTPAFSAWWRSLALLALGVICLSYHGKTLVIVPAFLACIHYASHGRAAYLPRLLASALLIAATLVATHYWFVRMDCPGDPIITWQHAHQTLAPQIGKSSGWTQTLLTVLTNLKLVRYVYLSAPLVHPMSHWLAYGQVSQTQENAFQSVLVVLWGLVLAAAIASFGLNLAKIRQTRHVPPQLVLGLALFGAASLWCVTQLTRNVYEASYVLPLLVMALLLVLGTPHGSALLTRVTGWLAAVLALSLPVSVALVVAIYGPDLWASAKPQAYLDQHPYSVPVYGYSRARQDILGAARQCGITPGRHAGNLLIDSETYFTFMENPMPQHELGVLSPQFHGVITDPIAYLKSRGSSGIILGCKWLPPELRRHAHSQGEFCCLAPPGW